MEANFGNAYDFHIYLAVPDFTYEPTLNLGGVRPLNPSSQSDYANSRYVAYTIEQYTNTQSENYYDIHVKMFAKWLATPIYIKVMHDGQEVAIKANPADTSGTVMSHMDNYGYGYSISSYVSLLGGEYVTFAEEINAYASHALSIAGQS
jgi:hypothetical protein